MLASNSPPLLLVFAITARSYTCSAGIVPGPKNTRKQNRLHLLLVAFLSHLNVGNARDWFQLAKAYRELSVHCMRFRPDLSHRLQEIPDHLSTSHAIQYKQLVLLASRLPTLQTCGSFLNRPLAIRQHPRRQPTPKPIGIHTLHAERPLPLPIAGKLRPAQIELHVEPLASRQSW